MTTQNTISFSGYRPEKLPENIDNIKKEHNIKLVAVIPFDDGKNKSDKYNHVLNNADEKIVL